MSEPAVIDAVLDISSAAYEEIKARLLGTALISTFEGRKVITFGNVGLRRENEEDRIKVYLVYQGKMVKQPKGDDDNGQPIEFARPEPEPGPDGDSTDAPECGNPAHEECNGNHGIDGFGN